MSSIILTDLVMHLKMRYLEILVKDAYQMVEVGLMKDTTKHMEGMVVMKVSKYSGTVFC